MSKIRQSARNQECTVRIPYVCNRDSSTTILAHINGAGMGKKQPDCEAAYCCSACHDELDGRTHNNFKHDRALLSLWHHEGAMRTRKILIDKGLLIIN